MDPRNNGPSDTLLVPRYVQHLASVQYARGKELALAGRRTEIDRVDLEELSDFARIDAQLAWRPHFDPSNNPHDQTLVARETEVNRELDQVVKAERLLLADLSEARLKAEPARAGIRRPQVPVALLVAFIAVFAATTAPTLHDSIFYTLTDEVLNWFCSLLIASFAGVSVVMGIFAAARLVPDQAPGRGAVVAGVVVSVGLAVLRAASARTPDEFALTVGLMAVEIGVILCADYVAARHQRAQALADAQEAEADKAGRTADTLRAELARVQQRKHELTAARDALDAEVTERSHPAIDVADLEALSVKAACNGYWNAIAENVGRMARTGGAS